MCQDRIIDFLLELPLIKTLFKCQNTNYGAKNTVVLLMYFFIHLNNVLIKASKLLCFMYKNRKAHEKKMKFEPFLNCNCGVNINAV